MKTIVIKRDGCKVSFDQTRISDAIKRAAEACQITDDDYCEFVAQSVSQSLAGRSNVDIREIQDAVENQLMASTKILPELILNTVMTEMLLVSNEDD